MGGTCISFKPQWSFPENNDFTHVFIEEPGFWISAVPNAAVCDWRAMWLGGLRCFLVYDMFLEKSSPEGSWVCWRIWCGASSWEVRTCPMRGAKALLWRTHPLIKLVVTVTFVMNKVEGSWARPWLKKNNFCFCQSQKCYVRLTDMVCFQKLGTLIDSDSIFRPIH